VLAERDFFFAGVPVQVLTLAQQIIPQRKKAFVLLFPFRRDAANGSRAAGQYLR
jgi:hypothetical protein